MNKDDIRKNIGWKIKTIRHMVGIEKGVKMTQADFTRLFNNTEPLDLQIETQSLGQYERGEVAVPADKYEKILGMGKNK